jgi:polyhydroxyalkanoate synthesis regulator phasin
MADQPRSNEPFDLAAMMEKTFLLGIGALEMGRERTEEFVDELIERGKMSKSDAKEVAEKLGDIAEKQQEVIRSTVVKETDRAMKTTGFATRADIDEIRSELAELKTLIVEVVGGAAAAGAAAGAVAAVESEIHSSEPTE